MVGCISGPGQRKGRVGTHVKGYLSEFGDFFVSPLFPSPLRCDPQSLSTTIPNATCPGGGSPAPLKLENPFSVCKHMQGVSIGKDQETWPWILLGKILHGVSPSSHLGPKTLYGKNLVMVYVELELHSLNTWRTFK